MPHVSVPRSVRFARFVVGLTAVLCVAASSGTAFAAGVDFNRDVRPILAANCYECHGPDPESRATDWRFDRLADLEGEAFVPGDPDASPIVQRLLSHDEWEAMPPPESKRRPTAAQIETIRRWVAEGARTAPHWAFVGPERPPVPDVTRRGWPRTPADAFVLASLEERGLSPRPDAEPGVLARRLSLALTGLPIEPARSARFAERYEAAPDAAVAELVDELLASPAYGERFAWGWLDAARYADTNGYQGDGYRVMWPWRDWLVRALNENRPFDVMTRQMLAGDELAADLSPADADWQSGDWLADPTAADRLLATGFLRNHRYDTGSGTIPAESRFENAADRLETVGTVWMGLTLQCARCHTHKFDPIEHREYYRLLSYFDDVPEVGSALKGASHPYVRVPSQDRRAELVRLRDRRERLTEELAAAVDSAADARAAWEAALAEDDEDGAGDAPPRVARGLRFRFAADPIRFDGTTTRQEPNDPIALCRGDRPWTISFWFRPESTDDAAIFSSVAEPEKGRQGIQADWVDGRVRVRHVCRWVNSYVEFRSRERLAVGEWRHVTFRSDGRMQGLAYGASLDGEDGAMELTHGVTNDGAGGAGKAPLILGGGELLPSFVGTLRDLRFYDRELTSAEVRSLADRRSTAALAAIPADRRTAAEDRTLRLAFRESPAAPPAVVRLRRAWIAARTELDERSATLPTAMVMRDAPAGPTHVRKAGQYDDPAEPVDRGTPAFLPPLPEGDRSRRALADWLTSGDHPLTARVAVNRVWQTLWGRGLVEQPGNFGVQCPEPRHAALLDWLATEYVRSGWDTKALVRRIVTSRTYRQASDAPAERWRLDPRNDDLARGPRFRLPIAAVRDQALALSGRLDRTPGGPPVLLGEALGKNGEPQKVPFETHRTRRTLYAFWKRNAPHPLLAVFDVADRNRCEVRVIRTNTPLQALVTLNEPEFVASAAALGARARAAAATRDGRLTWLWRACTGRTPDAALLDELGAMLDRYRALAAADPAGDQAPDEAAWTALGNVTLNLDATLTLE